ncbi:MAG: hypothetical protein GDA48_07895 [Hormoscilla sp. GM102CHS1]|nr:hypothetical protein [Hormoscilla sp. GM102CHS1]
MLDLSTIRSSDRLLACADCQLYIVCYPLPAASWGRRSRFREWDAYYQCLDVC